jgi:hypothetical protein
MWDIIGRWRMNKLFVLRIQPSLWLRSRTVCIAAAGVLDPLLLSPKKDIRIDMRDAELLLHLGELVVQCGLHSVVKIGNNNIWLSDGVLLC